MLTLKQAQTLSSGDTIYSTTSRDRKGNAHRVKITSVKLWKTRPDEVRIRWKFGLYEFGEFTQFHLGNWTLEA